MSKEELIFVYLPLILSLFGIAIYEIKTGLIKDKVVLLLLVYFLVANSLVSPQPVWHFLVGFLTLGALYLFITQIWYAATQDIIMGGGMIKLRGAVGAAVGIKAIVYIASAELALLILLFLLRTKCQFNPNIPSTPSLIIVLVCYLAYLLT